MRARIRRMMITAIAAVTGYAAGCAGGTIRHIPPRTDDYAFLACRVPLPHHVPKDPGGVPFRFAMAHDVIHERFPRHGPAYYEERNRLTRQKLAKLDPDDPARFPLSD